MITFNLMRFCFNALILLLVGSCVAKNQPVTKYSAPDYLILSDDIQLMEVDPLGNIYLVDDEDRLFKFDTTGQKLFMVVNNNLGRVHSLDVGNPFKIMLFYRDQQTILLLDNTLSEIQRIPLIQWMLDDVTAANLSPDNAIWLFDGSNKVLVKMSDKGDPLVTSDPFNIINPSSPRPDFIYDADQLLLLKETGQPLAVFNDFGNYLYSLEMDGDLFSVSKDALIINKGSSLEIRNMKGHKEVSTYPLPLNVAGNKIHFSQNHYYTLDEQGVFMVEVKP